MARSILAAVFCLVAAALFIFLLINNYIVKTVGLTQQTSAIIEDVAIILFFASGLVFFVRSKGTKDKAEKGSSQAERGI